MAEIVESLDAAGAQNAVEDTGVQEVAGVEVVAVAGGGPLVVGGVLLFLAEGGVGHREARDGAVGEPRTRDPKDAQGHRRLPGIRAGRGNNEHR